MAHFDMSSVMRGRKLYLDHLAFGERIPHIQRQSVKTAGSTRRDQKESGMRIDIVG